MKPRLHEHSARGTATPRRSDVPKGELTSIEELLEQVRAQLRSHAEPEFRAGVVQFFREPVDPIGVRARHLTKIVQSMYRVVKKWPASERDRFCEQLWQSGKLEEGVLVSHLYRRFSKQCGAREFRLFERWIDEYVRNWAHCDGVSSRLLAASIENEPALISRLETWTGSRNRWKRRASAVGLLQEAKKGRNIEAILRISKRLLRDPDDIVQKGFGWLLKEAYPKRPSEVMQFLHEHGAAVPRIVVRLTCEKMNPRDRAQAMTRH